ncbi:hypothetical protein H6F90_29695 [Trichocoleus sp. FACHB-591]|uniref:hypothetical protein n=1 Tax=Trichocoleus sp. FACHB-591 TaxID=2692872 RepID=UPI0016876808|nr:hypothetical protein [Trichocoleus sp. FACHB-591]MBD2099240.1 hypothetical protein [Trichocoleus sp. FACHB-591]
MDTEQRLTQIEAQLSLLAEATARIESKLEQVLTELARPPRTDRRSWFPIKEAYWQLGFKNPDALTYWLRRGRRENWLKLGVHFKPRFPGAGRSPLLVHLERCEAVATKRN